MTVTTVTSVSTAPSGPPATPWGRARQDLRDGLAARRLWSHLGWQDVRRRYQRSIVGPFWMTIAMAATSIGLGVLFSKLWNDPLGTFLPYIATGLIIWGFIGGCLSEGPDCFTSSDEMIKQLPVPFTALVFRMVWRQLITMAHNMIIYVVMLVIFFKSLSTHNYTMTGETCHPGGITCQPGFGWSALLAIPGFLITVIAMTAVSLVLGIVAARFRDIKPLIGAVVQLLFFFTPISWPLDTLVKEIGSKQWIIQINPLFHFLQIVRQPLIGQQVQWWNWVVAGGLTVLCWIVAALMMHRYRHRIAYWL